jgi:hypothetical protein
MSSFPEFLLIGRCARSDDVVPSNALGVAVSERSEALKNGKNDLLG